MMKRHILGTALAGLLLSSPAAVQASDSLDFSGCDGLRKPKGKDDGMRGAATISAYSWLSGPGASPSGKIAACDRALSNPKLLPHQKLRRAHLLRARAAAYLDMKSPDKALADLDAAEAELTGQADDVFYRRSMGVSLMLLRAVAEADRGDFQRAGALAREAAALRPYAIQVQLTAAMLQHAARPIGDSAASPWDPILRLDPSAASMVVAREAEIGNFGRVAELADRFEIGLPGASSVTAGVLVQPVIDMKAFQAASTTLSIAYAQATLGHTDAARERLAKLDAYFAAPDDTPIAGSLSTRKMIKGLVAADIRLLEARIAVAEGRVEDAQSVLAGDGVAFNAAALELFEAMRAASGAGNSAPENTTKVAEQLAEQHRKALVALSDTLLIAPESHRSVVDYEKSRPNILGALVGGALSMGTSLLGGIDRTAGFRSREQADGTVFVEFTGNTTSGPMVQEMTLLRAAELAQAANKPYFTIVDRTDYSRFLVTTQYGAETSRVPTGYKSELTVRFMDDAAADGAGFETVSIIDALGPLYYENGAAPAGTRS